MSDERGGSKRPDGATRQLNEKSTGGEAPLQPRSGLTTRGSVGGDKAPPKEPPVRPSEEGGGGGHYNRRTEVLRPGSTPVDMKPGHPDAPPARNLGRSATQIIRPGMNREEHMAPTPAESPEDLVAGWLVIIGGPGYGKAIDIGYGRNSVGRNAANRVSLDFGDSSISGENHCFVLYDGRGRKYYLQSGESVNLTYLNGAPVLAPTELKIADHIQIGNTTLRFIPLCGDSFDWSDKAITQSDEAGGM